MRVLVCVDSYPLYKFDGGDLQLYNIIRNIDRKIEFYLLYTDDRSATIPKEQVFDDSIFKGLIQLETKTRNIFIKSKFLNQELRGIVEKYKIDLIITRSNKISLYVSKGIGIPNILDYVDSRTLLWRRELEQSRTITDKLKNLILYTKWLFYESFVLRKFSAVVVVSQIDKSSIERRSKKINVCAIPNGVDTVFFSPSESLEVEDNTVLFFGNMSYSPNVDAVMFIHSQVLPLIVSENTNVRFLIAGKSPTEDVCKLADGMRTFVIGYTPDIRELIQRSTVVLIPMRKGAGIKNKLLEAMSMEKAIVTSSVCAESLSDKAKEHLCIGDTPEELARGVLFFLENKDARLYCGKKNRNAIIEEYSWSKASKKMQQLMESLTKTP